MAVYGQQDFIRAARSGNILVWKLISTRQGRALINFSEEHAMDLGEESVKLRSKAERIRAKAVSMDDPHIRDELLNIAEQYDALANRAQQAHSRQ
jgi:hypothetical protein